MKSKQLKIHFLAQEKTRLLISDQMGIPIGAATILYVGGYLMTFLDWRYVFWFAGFGCGASQLWGKDRTIWPNVTIASILGHRN